MRTLLETAGERVEVTCAHRRLAGVLAEGIGELTADKAAHLAEEPAAETAETAGNVAGSDGPGRPDVRISVEESAEPFETAGWQVLSRDAWQRPGQVILRNACSAGLDLLLTTAGPTLNVAARWRPSAAGRAASALLRARSRLLIRAVLLQYPALWWAQQRGRVPLHASVCTIAGRVALIAGPGGVGKSTLVQAELADGGEATCDNLCVSDGRTAWGLLEPRRLPAGSGLARAGRRMPHGRREAAWPNRSKAMVPDLLVVLRRGTGPVTTTVACPPPEAARCLTAGTYMAGELRRYWAFAATAALGSGLGEPHPALGAIAAAMAEDLPCVEITLGGRPGLRPHAALARLLATAA